MDGGSRQVGRSWNSNVGGGCGFRDGASCGPLDGDLVHHVAL